MGRTVGLILKVEDTPSEFDGMDVEQLKAYAEEKGIDIGNATSTSGIIKKIREAAKED